MNHLWLGRVLGERADNASFVSAYSLAKRAREEFEQAVQLNPRNAEALADLGEFYYSAPGVVGGGTSKAQGVAAQLDKIDPARAHELRASIAQENHDYVTAEGEFRQAIAASAHPAFQWMRLASFFRRNKRYQEMETAVQNGRAAAGRDRQHSAVALFNGASVLIKVNRNPAFSIKMLQEYLASSNQTEEAPAFVAHMAGAAVHADRRLGGRSAGTNRGAGAGQFLQTCTGSEDLTGRMELKRNNSLARFSRPLAIALALGCGVAGHAQVSLKTVVDLAQNNSASVKMAQADVAKAQAAFEQSRDAYIPSVNFGTGIPAFPSVGFTGQPPSIYTMTVESLVFSIPQKHYMGAARSGWRAAESRLKDAREQVVLDTSNAYIELDTLNTELAAARQQEEFANRLAEIEQQRSETIDPLHSLLLVAKLTAANLRLGRLHLETRAATLSKLLADAHRPAGGRHLTRSWQYPGDPADRRRVEAEHNLWH